MSTFNMENYNDADGSLLDTFDFDSFLNTGAEEPAGLGFTGDTLHWNPDGVETAGES